MKKTTRLAAATAMVLVLGVPAAFAQSSGMTITKAQNTAMTQTPSASTIKLFEQAKTALPDAISTAEQNAAGQNENSKAFAAAFVDQNGTPVYLVDTAANNSVYELQIDANSGKPIGNAKITKESELNSQAKTMLSALPNAKTSLADAIGNATGKLGGKAINAAMTDNNGQMGYIVTVVDNGQVKKASVDQANGNVAALPETGGGYGSSTQK